MRNIRLVMFPSFPRIRLLSFTSRKIKSILTINHAQQLVRQTVLWEWIVPVNRGVVMMHPQTSDSDESLRESILAIFAADNRTAQMDIRVGVLNGIVHLAGKVACLSERATVEELASQVSGVRGVVNRIEAPGAPSPARTINLELPK